MPGGDLRLRLVGGLVLVACIASLRSLAVAVPVLGLVAALVLAGRPPPALWRRLLHVEGFMLVLFATLPFTVAGPALLAIGPLRASSAGLALAALVAAKASASVLVLMALVGDVEPVRIGAAMRSLHVPERLIRLFLVTARYAMLIRAEARRMHEAMRARAFTPRSNRHSWRSYGNLIGMLLVRALERAERVEEAMLCRGYAGRFPRPRLPAPTRVDWLGFAAVSGGGLVALMADRL